MAAPERGCGLKQSEIFKPLFISWKYVFNISEIRENMEVKKDQDLNFLLVTQLQNLINVGKMEEEDKQLVAIFGLWDDCG